MMTIFIAINMDQDTDDVIREIIVSLSEFVLYYHGEFSCVIRSHAKMTANKNNFIVHDQPWLMANLM